MQEPLIPIDNGLNLQRVAAIYDQTAAFYDTVVAELQASAKLSAIEVLARQPGERFLEVGAGTAWAFERIVAASGVAGAIASDVAAGMLEVSRQRLQDDAGLANPPLLLADTTALPFAGNTLDCLLITYTLEVLPTESILPALRECLRVLRPGGRAIALNLTPGLGADAAMTDDWQQRFALDPEAFGGARPLQASGLMQAAGFIEVTRRYAGPTWPSEVLRGLKAG